MLLIERLVIKERKDDVSPTLLLFCFLFCKEISLAVPSCPVSDSLFVVGGPKYGMMRVADVSSKLEVCFQINNFCLDFVQIV